MVPTPRGCKHPILETIRANWNHRNYVRPGRSLPQPTVLLDARTSYSVSRTRREKKQYLYSSPQSGLRQYGKLVSCEPRRGGREAEGGGLLRRKGHFAI